MARILFHLGNIYKAIGYEKDAKEVSQYLKLLAKQEDMVIELTVGFMNGIGVEKDSTKAKPWFLQGYQKLASQGEPHILEERSI